MTLPSFPDARGSGSPDSDGVDPAVDEPISYIKRTQAWYLALGYGNPYEWAHFAEVPFTRLSMPLSKARVCLVTTAAPYRPDKGPQGPGAPYNAAAKFFEVYSGDTAIDHDLRIAHVSIDRRNASMADSGCWFPLPALRRAAAAGQVGSVAPRFHGLPTDRSQRRTMEVYAPDILSRCRDDGVDAAILVGNCPVCHQSVSLVARHLERHGIATVVIGAARDIVERCGVPRLVFSDFPLGNAAGRPRDPESQTLILRLALLLLESAPAARTTVQSPLRWSEASTWKLDYMNIERVSEEERARLREENDRVKQLAKEAKQVATEAKPVAKE